MNQIRGFEFIAGCLALNLVDTWAGRGGAERELLTSPQALADWMEEARLFRAERVSVTGQQLADARELREAILHCAVAGIDHRDFGATDIAVLNRAAGQPPLRPEYRDGELRYVAQDLVSAALSDIAADALELITTQRVARVRRCSGCAMVFEDTSRPGSRRWCSSAKGCGNKEKTRNLRARRRINQE